jgi:signal transduction histidine kinase/phage shock protein PspC (stress-responsive transcriptional regulator)
VAAGLAAWRGFSPTTVRIVLAVAALISQGWAVPFYVLGWLLIPAKGEHGSIASRAKHDSRGVAVALALASVLGVFLFLAGALNDGAIETYGWPQVFTLAGLTLIWRNAPDAERDGIRRLVAPLGAGGKAGRRATRLRFAGAAVLLAVGLGLLLSLHVGTELLKPLGGFLLVAAALVLLLGPWWLRIARDLVLERQARARAEERSDIAARVHDSVLQTLALIQRRAEDPQAVVQLARAQERELRSWLFEGRAPGDADASSFAEGVRQIQRDVEARHGVPVEIVTVADCPLDDHLSALLAASREATVNAAKWSGAAVISVFAEVEPDKVNVAVRDRGKGFDPAAVPGDRKGVAESIRGRMSRHGGEATVQSAPGEGTKVTLSMPRRARSQSTGQASTAAEGPGR